MITTLEPGCFAYVIVPQRPADFSLWRPGLARLPFSWVEPFLPWTSPKVLGRFEPIVSPYNRAAGWLLGVPLTPRHLAAYPVTKILPKLLAAGQLARCLGAKVLGLGEPLGLLPGVTSALAESLDIAVTNGNTYTVSAALEATLALAQGAKFRGAQAHFVLVGADEPEGGSAARLLARPQRGVRRLTLVGRRDAALAHLAQRILAETGLVAARSRRLGPVAARAHAVLNFSRRLEAAGVAAVKPGAIVCDAVPPFSWAQKLRELRPDVQVLTGGLAKIPEPLPRLHKSAGGRKGHGAEYIGLIQPALAETIILALAGHRKPDSLGRAGAFERIDAMQRLAWRHGLPATVPRPVHYGEFT